MLSLSLVLVLKDSLTGASKGIPSAAKCVTEILGGGTKNKEVRGDRMFKLQYCTKLCQLILRKIIKIAATRCHILRLKCTKFDFGWGSAPDPAAGAHSAPPDLLAGFEGSYF